MKLIISSLFFLLFLQVYAQKDTSQQIDAQDVKIINIDTDEVFKINIKTTKTDFILISTHAEGEYSNDIALNSEVKENSLFLRTQFREILQSGFDKLSAHKVFSLELTIEIPENLQVVIKSNIASVEAAGHYEFLQIQLNSGYCELSSFVGDALINTLNGRISIQTTDATVTATSRNGEVNVKSNLSGKHQITANSINGAILVMKN